MPEAKSNKVKFNIKNAHVAILTEGEDGTITWGTPHHEPGAVSLSLDASGETSPFYADGIVYYRSASNSGYEGDLEMAQYSDWFRENVLKEEKDAKGVLIENSNVEPARFAFLFEFDGDVKSTRHVLYDCTATRPAIEGSTTEDTKDPTTETSTITAAPLPDGTVKAKTTAETDAEAYNSWYQEVYVKSEAAGASA
ncbi:MAG: phage tail protein [Eubacteriales bacterium]|nr:phage tail protein [Eubacteriales bacterium]